MGTSAKCPRKKKNKRESAQVAQHQRFVSRPLYFIFFIPFLLSDVRACACACVSYSSFSSERATHDLAFYVNFWMKIFFIYFYQKIFFFVNLQLFFMLTVRSHVHTHTHSYIYIHMVQHKLHSFSELIEPQFPVKMLRPQRCVCHSLSIWLKSIPLWEFPPIPLSIYTIIYTFYFFVLCSNFISFFLFHLTR